jgi:PilZ domain
MGQRREPRTAAKLSVRIFGTDANGRAFSESVSTVNISRSGARLEGVRAEVHTGDVIGVSCGTKKSRFCVKWVGRPATPQAHQIGVLNVTPEKTIWDVSLPGVGMDPFGRQSASERREYPRLKCMNSAQLRPEGDAAAIWSKVLDLSVGGCFVEMSIPLKRGTKLNLELWLTDQKKLSLVGKVVNSRPGFGIGIQFGKIEQQDLEELRRFLKSITKIPT